MKHAAQLFLWFYNLLLLSAVFSPIAAFVAENVDVTLFCNPDLIRRGSLSL